MWKTGTVFSDYTWINDRTGHKYTLREGYYKLKLLNKGGVMCVFKVGDEVEVLKDSASGSYWEKGEHFVVEQVVGDRIYGKNPDEIDNNYVDTSYLKLVKNKYKFEVGDKIRQVRNGANTTNDDNGKEAFVTKVGLKYSKEGDGILIKTIGDWILKNATPRGVAAFELVKRNSKTGENKMKKVISDIFIKTANALVVEKHLGSQITDNFIGGLILKQFKGDILEEARRLEAEKIARKG